MEITYFTNKMVTVEQYISLLTRSTLSERRPVNDKERVKKMVQNGNVLITAWDNDKLIGVARTITDFAYCSYLSDLAVDQSYQRQGIGVKLISLTREVIGQDVMLLLISAPAANEYYPKVGFTKIDRAWILFPENEN